MTEDTQVRKPRNKLELFKWLIFEPVLLKKYSDSLSKKKVRQEFLKSYFWIVLIVIIVWLGTNLVVSIINPPIYFPNRFSKDFVEGWENATDWFSRFVLLSTETLARLAVMLAIGLVFGLALVLAKGLAFGLAGGLAGGLTLGLAFGLAVGLAFGLAFGLAGGLAGGLTLGLAFGLAFGLAVGLAFGLAVGLVLGLAVGLAVGLDSGFYRGLANGIMFFLSWNIFYFRILPFYPVHFIKSIFSSTLLYNPYWKDGGIWVPILGLKEKLIQQSKQEPKEAFDFINFLLEYRPFQKNLAMHLTHTSTAGLWIQNEFHSDILKKTPIISKDKPKFQPSEEWYQKLEAVREELVASEQQSSIGYKVEYYERYLSRLKEFEQINLRESSRWNHYYFDALKKWLQMAKEEHERLKLLAKTKEPVTRNVYRAGDVLTPEFDKNIFVGRDDLKGELQHKILSSPQMPLFLIYGQRRVGKTSLLKFLPGILGTRFKVVFMDLQALGSIREWFNKLKKEFDNTLNIDSPPLPQSEDKNWLDVWKDLQNHLEEVAQKQEYKIILSFDEYEKAHTLFQKDPEAAEDLLAAMRSFSQHQDKIVFLFVGAALFSELKEPHWSNYFVQAVLLKVDYLKKEETFKLIDVAKLDYPQEVLDKIYYLTRGHPTLVQRICHEMVNTANTKHRKTMTMKDLEEILEKHIYQQQNGVTEVFWGQFCHKETMKTTVRQVIAGETPTDKKSLFKLTEHGFVIQENDRHKMRVPIFEEWITRFGEVV